MAKRDFVAINTYIKRKERSLSKQSKVHFKELGKEHTKPKVIRRKEITKIRAEINEIQTRKIREKINETKQYVLK